MTLEEQKLAICEKLPELIKYHPATCPCIICTAFLTEERDKYFWKATDELIHWPTEGLQVCHEAEKLLSRQMVKETSEQIRYVFFLEVRCGCYGSVVAPYESRLEALCKVWWPERFKKRLI